jgi:hypothetical protein
VTFIYPTASTVAVFINGMHIDQAYQVQYKESTNKIPIYGYNDHIFTKVAKGRQAVSGVLVINFMFPGYLNAALDSKYQAESSLPPALYPQKDIQGSLREAYDESLEKTIEQQLATELPSLESTASRQARAEYIADLISSKDTKQKTIKALVNQFENRDAVSFDTPAGKLPLDKLRIKSLESPIELSSRNITIDIYYQDPQSSDWYLSFKNVHFYDVSQTISQAGAEGSSEPLYEVYSFMASQKVIKLLA